MQLDTQTLFSGVDDLAVRWHRSGRLVLPIYDHGQDRLRVGDSFIAACSISTALLVSVVVMVVVILVVVVVVVILIVIIVVPLG